MTPPTHQRLPLRLASAVIFLYALGYPIGSLAVHAMSPGIVLALRFGISAAILLPIVLLRGIALPKGRMLAHVVVVGLLIQAVQFIGIYSAMRLGISPTLIALIIAMNPLATTVLAGLFLAERIRVRQVLALALALAAVAVSFAGRLDALHGSLAGIGLAMLGLLGASGGAVYQQRHVRDVDPWAAGAVGLAAATVPATLFAALTPVAVTDVRIAITSMTAMVILSSILGTSLFMLAVRRAGATRTSLLFGVVPAVSSVLSWLLVGDRPDLGIVAGIVLGAAACWLGRAQPPDSADSQPAGRRYAVASAGDQGEQARV